MLKARPREEVPDADHHIAIGRRRGEARNGPRPKLPPTATAKSRMVKSVVAAILTLLLAGRVAGWEKRRDAHGKTIIAYYASWQWYDRSGLAKPSNLDHSLVTRYTFAFFQINEQGDIWGTDAWGDPNVLFGEYDWNWVPGGANTYCSWDGPGEPPTCAGHKYHTGLISQAHSAGVEVYPSIGGWTLSDPFSKLAENSAARTKFAENCVKLIEDYDFDGIDIDWEVRTPVLFYYLLNNHRVLTTFRRA